MSVDAEPAGRRPLEPTGVNCILRSSDPDSLIKSTSVERVSVPKTLPSTTTDIAATTEETSPTVAGLKRWSTSIAPRNNKNTSFSFPVVPSQFSNPYQPNESRRVPEKEVPATDSGEKPSVLTALAAQERKVLELKEALHTAEDELKRLKKQYAAYESTRKKNDIRRAQTTRPVSVAVVKTSGLPDDHDGSSTWLYEEMERRKNLLKSTKSSRRRVFPGSRHTRQLSLLTTDKNGRPISPQPDELQSARSDLVQRRARLSASPDLPTLDDEDAAEETNSEKQPLTPQRDAFVRTSKQMATDLREGLWTFFEDLRQATVGDDARQTKFKSPDDSVLIDTGGSFWNANSHTEANTTSPIAPSPPTVRKIARPSRLSTALPKPKSRIPDFIDTTARPVSRSASRPSSAAQQYAPGSSAAALEALEAPYRSHANSDASSTSQGPPSSTTNTTPPRNHRLSGIPTSFRMTSPQKESSRIPSAGSATSDATPAGSRSSRLPRFSTADVRPPTMIPPPSMIPSPTKGLTATGIPFAAEAVRSPSRLAGPGTQMRRPTSYYGGQPPTR